MSFNEFSIRNIDIETYTYIAVLRFSVCIGH